MLSCKDINNLASDHIDNHLSPLLKMKVKMHLLMCHKCRRFVNQLSLTVDTLKNLKKPQPEDQFVEKQVNELMEITKNLNSTSNQAKNR